MPSFRGFGEVVEGAFRQADDFLQPQRITNQGFDSGRRVDFAEPEFNVRPLEELNRRSGEFTAQPMPTGGQMVPSGRTPQASSVTIEVPDGKGGYRTVGEIAPDGSVRPATTTGALSRPTATSAMVRPATATATSTASRTGLGSTTATAVGAAGLGATLLNNRNPFEVPTANPALDVPQLSPANQPASRTASQTQGRSQTTTSPAARSLTDDDCWEEVQVKLNRNNQRR